GTSREPAAAAIRRAAPQGMCRTRRPTHRTTARPTSGHASQLPPSMSSRGPPTAMTANMPPTLPPIPGTARGVDAICPTKLPSVRGRGVWVKKRLSFTVRDEIAARIASGRLPPGAKLPAEPELAEELGVSRATLREALRSLEEDGFVTRTRGAGTHATRR